MVLLIFHFMFKFFNLSFYEIMWKGIVQPYRPQPTIYVIRCMRLACSVTSATDTHSPHTMNVAAGYIILLNATLDIHYSMFKISRDSKLLS
jgi:hypothetical protein